MKKPTIKDIARLVGVSYATVSLSFQENSRISERTRKKVLDIAEKHNYIPNIAARDIRVGVSRSIGVLVTDITNTFYAILVREAQQVVHERGYQLVIAESQWEADKEITAIRYMAQSRVQGLLFCCSETNTDCFEELRKLELPFVLLDTYPEGYGGSYVDNDFEEAGRTAAGHLAEIGCSKFAFITGRSEEKQFSSFKRLEAGFSEGCKGKGEYKGTFSGGMTIEQGREGMKELLRQASDVDGVFCVNDMCALGAMEILESKGRHAGSDVAVIGVDDNAVGGLSRISLSSIRLPYADMACIAANSIIDRIEKGKDKAIHASVKPELIKRKSTLAFNNRLRLRNQFSRWVRVRARREKILNTGFS